MSALPPDLPRLRTLRTWLGYALAEVEAKIAQLEQEQAAAAAVRARREPPEWVLSYLRAGGQAVPDSVHRGDCRMVSGHTRALTREQALHALTDGRIRACEICRAGPDLGFLD
ncbi:DUF6233 domain-containing protein [Streptomyces sp. NPDC014779]|uniref:DUF6233 domain-containing protein n=1 Tax=Streptomyces sp. NPDC014779 TaxID=3364911 RepID=UPI0036FE1C38